MMKEKDKEEEKSVQDVKNEKTTPVKKSQEDIILELRRELESEKNRSGNTPDTGLKDLTEAIKSGFSGSTKNNGDQNSFEHSYSDQASLDAEDVLDEKDMVMFVSHKVLYVIADDKRNGKNVRAPFALIKFKHDSTRLVKNGKETDQFNISTYTCRSKIELEWLRNHSLFGVMFFDKISKVITADAQKASRLAKHVLSLRSVGQHQLIQMAKSKEIPVVDDLNYLRSMIAQATVEEEMIKIDQKTKEMFSDQQLEAEMIGKEVVG